MHTEQDIRKALSSVTDPEIPVLTITDMGIVRDINIQGDAIQVDITPTYSGCPAMKTIADESTEVLKNMGFKHISIEEVLEPAWTTDWLTTNGRQKLEAYGIAPPEEASRDKSLLSGEPKSVTCPQCKSKNTKMVSQFGSTACKALYQCQECKEPFDYFKCI